VHFYRQSVDWNGLLDYRMENWNGVLNDWVPIAVVSKPIPLTWGQYNK